MRKDYYAILGIEPGADKETIQKAFHQLAKIFHPDVSSAPDAEDRFKEINEAYQVLIALASDGQGMKRPWARATSRARSIPDYVAIYLRGYALYQQKLYAFATLEFDKALAIKPDYLAALEYRGRSYARLHERQLALKDFDRALALDPDDAFILRERADIRFALKDLEGAIADATSALRIYPRMASAYNVRGNAYAQSKEYYKAIEDYSSAIDIRPEHAPYYNNRGLTYSALRQYEDSIRDYTQAIELDHLYVDPYLNRSNDYAYVGRDNDALADLSTAIRMSSENHRLYNNRGRVNLRLARYDEALEDFGQALTLDSGYALAYLNRGVVHLIRREYDSALADIDLGEKLLGNREYRVLRNSPYATTTLIRAMAYHGQGKFALAHQLWLEKLVPIDRQYLDLQWVINEHQILSPLQGPLDDLLRSLPRREA